MTVRISAYTILLYEDILTKGGFQRNSDGEMLLPPIFPIVLYNGARPWSAKRNIAELIMQVTSGLQNYLPQSNYFLLEIRNITEKAKEKAKSITARFFSA